MTPGPRRCCSFVPLPHERDARAHAYELVLRGLTVLGLVLQFDYLARALFLRIDDAGIEGPGIDMQAHRALVEFAGIINAVHGLERIDRAGLARIHFDGVRSFQVTRTLFEILLDQVKVFHSQASDGNCHPAILFTMVVHRTGLSDLPADGDQFVERSLIDQIAGVMLLVPGEIGGKSFRHHRGLLQKTNDLADMAESRLGKFL
jgi:hypothetical protein